MGIFTAIGAIFSWACGDFLIQRATKKIGDWGTVFFIGIAGFIMLTPFVYKELPETFNNPQTLIFLSLSESYIALTVGLGIFVNKDKIQKHQLFGILIVIIGIILLSTVI